MIWMRPNLSIDRPIDSAVFDVDGVLIDTSRSYRLSVIATTEYIVGDLLGLWQRGAVEREVRAAGENAETRFPQVPETRERGAAEREWPNPVRPSGSGEA